MDIADPIVIDPPGYDVAKGWAWCHEESKDGCVYPNGEINWRAAFSADPGCCSCPKCHKYHWSFGRRHRCTGCGFEYPVDWWPMYSWGVSAARHGDPHNHAERMKCPYYRYGYEHPVGDPCDERDRIDWPTVLAEVQP